MDITAQKIKGAYLITPEKKIDERGYFARIWCRETFSLLGLNAHVEQCSISQNKQAGTLRGMHYQAAPYAECKLVSCPRGRIYDVMLDMRENSPTYGHWQAFDLNAEKAQLLYIPEGVAHGFQTLVDDTVVLYQISTQFHPDYCRRVKYDNPLYGIQWPLPVTHISAQDSAA